MILIFIMSILWFHKYDMNDAEQMVHCYILKVGSMILHTLPFKEVVHNYYNLVELHNTVIVVTNVNYYTYSKVEYQMFYFLSSEYFFFYKTHSCHHWHMKYVKFLICSLQNEIYIHIYIYFYVVMTVSYITYF